MGIEVRNISKQFGKFQALNDVSVKIETGELVAILGPSGSGKTTLLRIIAGLEPPQTGEVLFAGSDMTGTSAGSREVGFVFQHYALFRHMSVYENVAFGLRVKARHLRPSKTEIRDKVMNLLKMVQLDSMAYRNPSQLSGGQRQRVALARALAVEPKVLLLDEPFGALDARVRRELRQWLRRLHDELHITGVFVTHDQEEALEVADRVVVMNHGKIEQIGTPEEVYDHPATPFVYSFLGSVNLFHGRANNGRVDLGPLSITSPEYTEAHDTPAVAYVRPHDMDISREPNGKNSVPAIVRHIHSAGPLVRLDLEGSESPQRLEVVLTRERYRDLDLHVDQAVYVTAQRIKVFTG